MKSNEYLNSSEAVRQVSNLGFEPGGKILLDVIRDKKDEAMKSAVREAGKGQNLKALRLLNVAKTCSDILDFVDKAVEINKHGEAE
jgi:hypothetical protein